MNPGTQVKPRFGMGYPGLLAGEGAGPTVGAFVAARALLGLTLQAMSVRWRVCCRTRSARTDIACCPSGFWRSRALGMDFASSACAAGASLVGSGLYSKRLTQGDLEPNLLACVLVPPVRSSPVLLAPDGGFDRDSRIAVETVRGSRLPLPGRPVLGNCFRARAAPDGAGGGDLRFCAIMLCDSAVFLEPWPYLLVCTITRTDVWTVC